MNITYNNETPEDYGWWLATRPIITPSEVEVDRYPIPNRRGELIGNYETRGNAHVTFTLHCRHSNIVQGKIVSDWLREAGHQLILSDESAYYYEVLATKVNSYDNKADDYKRVEVEMEVYPYKYKRNQNDVHVSANTTQTLTIDASDICEPLYRIYGSGSFTVNNETVTVSGSTSIAMDVRRRIAYVYGSSPIESADNLVNGDYNKLVLKQGNNSITTVGCELYISKREGFII